MYKELAKYYDLIYSWKDYEKETAKINKLIKKQKNSDGNKLLDVACGTGKHLEYLKKKFSCTGIDLNEEMIAIAKSNISDISFDQADMINFNLNEFINALHLDILLRLVTGLEINNSY